MRTPNVRLHIDRLVLRGIPREHRDAFVRAFEHELARQLAQPGTQDFRSRHAPALEATKLAPSGGTTPRQMGASAARALVQGLKG